VKTKKLLIYFLVFVICACAGWFVLKAGLARLHNMRGLRYESKGSYARAAGEYAKALSADPRMLQARFNLANLYFKTGRFPEALGEYAVIRGNCPAADAGRVENNIANVYEAQGLVEEAVRHYRAALSLDPGMNFAHFNLARIYRAQGNMNAAGAQVLESLSEIKGRAGSADCRAIETSLEMAGSFDNAGSFYNNLGVNLAGKLRWEAAVSAFKRAVELDPENAGYYYNLGLVYFNMGQAAKAKGVLKKALEINPNHIAAKRLIKEKKPVAIISGQFE
jgi:tetratricopeptide (TPR) repeat protein